MKSKNLSVLAAAFITATFLLLTATAASAGDPIPGVDVSLEQIPGGVRGQANTDANGEFGFKNLPAGRYVVHVRKPRSTGSGTMQRRAAPDGGPEIKVEDHNSSRSNISQAIDKPGGQQEFTLRVEISR